MRPFHGHLHPLASRALRKVCDQLRPDSLETPGYGKRCSIGYLSAWSTLIPALSSLKSSTYTHQLRVGDAASRAELQITLQPKEHILPANQFTGLPCFERTDGKRVFIQTRQAESMRFSSHGRATSSKYLMFHGSKGSEEPVSGCLLYTSPSPRD